MKKLFIVSLFSGFGLMAGNAVAATPWWLQPTICKPNPTNCYTSMGRGFDSGMWDAAGNCRGMKYICPEATAAADSSPVLIDKPTLASGAGINSDFDINTLSGDCFGARKTTANGSKASVSGTFVNVWCTGALNSPDEIIATGEIKFGTQPKCKDLADNGWAGVLNQSCYGKKFNPSNYYIECTGTDLLPNRLIVLNGANPITGTGSGSGYLNDASAAKSLFDTMQSVSTTKRAERPL